MKTRVEWETNVVKEAPQIPGIVGPSSINADAVLELAKPVDIPDGCRTPVVDGDS